MPKLNIRLVAVGKRLPGWTNEGFDFYAKRLQNDVRLQLREVAPYRRNASDNRIVACREEAKRIQTTLPDSAWLITLDEHGRLSTSKELATKLDRWQQRGKPVAIVIGGADGLAPELLSQADDTWSLSPLTLPHGLVRVLVAEQIYRAWSLLVNHPYHRE